MSIIRLVLKGIFIIALIPILSAVCSAGDAVNSAQVIPSTNPVLLTSPFSGKQGWARTWGGDTDKIDEARAVAVWKDGAIYVVGKFSGTANFNTNPKSKAVFRTSSGNSDAFLCRYDAGGDFKWARTWGGPGIDSAEGVEVDPWGNIFVTGTFVSNADFNPDKDAFEYHSSQGGPDVFLSRFDANGNHVWTKTWGGTGEDTANAIAIDIHGNVAIVGEFMGGQNYKKVDFDPGLGTDAHSSSGKNDCYMTKFDMFGEHSAVLVWGGTDDDYCLDVAVGTDGNVFVTGGFFSNNLDFSGSLNPKPATTKSPNGGCDVYLAKYQFDGKVQWVRSWGAEGYEGGTGVAVDPSDGAVYVCGNFYLDVDFSGQGTPGFSYSSMGDTDGFISRFDKDGNIQWVDRVGGPDWDGFQDVAVTPGGFVYATGYFTGPAQFNLNDIPEERACAGESDYFITQYFPSGDRSWTRTFGGPGRDEPAKLATDTFNGVYVTGFFEDTLNFMTRGSYERTASGASDAFIASYPQEGTWEMKLNLYGVREKAPQGRG